MSEANYHSVVGEAVPILIKSLLPFVERVCAPSLPPGASWTELLRRKDALAGRQMPTYGDQDLSLILRAMTERLGDAGYPFSRHLSRPGQNYANELRDVRNRWAHNETFTAPEAYRALDSVELLLRAITAPEAATEIAALKGQISPFRQHASTAEPTSTDVRPLADSAATHPQQPAQLTATATARIDIQAISDLSYPMAHCRIPVVDTITIDGVTDALRGAVLKVDVISGGEALTATRELHLDLAVDRPTTLRDIDLALAPASMLTVEAQRPGQIEATLLDASGTVIAKTDLGVNILAGDQWKATPLQLALEMLAAHVQPNSSTITALMPEVSNRLETLTGRSGIDGYQSENPERVDAIAQAVYDTMSTRDVRYAEPPASWGLDGQKIRTPADVLEGRLGTCLDTTVTMAAALEQAGINTTIWVLKEHALLGYWRIDAALPTISTTEVIDVINLVDLGHLRLVETTMLTGGSKSAPFSDAVDAARISNLGGNTSKILGVTDIRQARLSRIFPLPSRALTPTGDVVVTEYTPATGPTYPPYQPSKPSRTSPDVQETVPPRVAKWKNALLDLSLRNKLINYTERAGYRLEVPGPAIDRFEDLINDAARITLLASDEVKEIDLARGIRYGRDLPEREREALLADKHSTYIDLASSSYKTRLRNLAYKAKTIIEETGANNLYVTLGTLHWRLDDRELQSPLVLAPVIIDTTNRGERYALTVDESGMSTPNYCLIEKLRVAFGLEIPEFIDPTQDASGIDLTATFDAVRHAIAKAGLHFRVEESAHLAILQFAKFPLWKDLNDSWKILADNSLVSHLIDSPAQPYLDPVAVGTEHALDKLGDEVPVPADSSQLRAIAEAAAGRTFVLEGPPGTGKSQTITNLLAHAMAAGRRVLFVAEKRAALDVVKRRLEAVGLGELSLDLHNKASRPAAVREQIRAALDLRVNADTAALNTHAETAESSRNALARYARRLHEKNAAGLSLYTARNSELASEQNVSPLTVPRDLITTAAPQTLDAVRAILRRLPEAVDLAQPRAHHPWRFINSLPEHGLDTTVIHDRAVEFDSALADAVEHGLAIEAIARCTPPSNFAIWANLCGAPRRPLAEIDALHAASMTLELTTLSNTLAGLAANPPQWLSVASADAVDLDIPAIHTAAVAADESGLLVRKKRRRAVLEQLTDVLSVDPKTISLKALTSLVAQIRASYDAVQELRHRVATLPTTIIDRPWNPLVARDVAAIRQELAWMQWTADALCARPDDPHIQDLRAYYSTRPIGDLSDQLPRIAPAWAALAASTGIAEDPQVFGRFVTDWWQTRTARHLRGTASIENWANLIRLIEPLKAVGMDETRTAILDGELDADDASLGFTRGLAFASIAERSDTTALGSFNAPAHEKTIDRYRESLHAIRKELPRAIPAALLEKRRFDANAAVGQIGNLRRQLDRRRGGLSVRGLIDHYGELITEIMPCTLMSPDSVARFFPARADLFDIVVFDEASQIRVADAIGAMGRSRSVIVVGDSKQMPPSTGFGDTNAGIDDDDSDQEFFLDEESILTECVHAQVPQQWLSWHYRSQDEALIAFSNQHYYNSRLASFPAPRRTSSTGGLGISLRRVDGTFDRSGKGKSQRTNRVEADAIVADILRRFTESADEVPSLGVITFNAQQRDLVDNLLRDSGDERVIHALDEKDGLFVKNLENVQGDERDTILFSVAFSANDRGVVPLNFGPLSRPGGERRFNVAVTRARREIVLYCSFDPADLRAEETTQVGTKHLKTYLQMAAQEADGGNADTSRRMPVIDRHRDDIADALRAEGVFVTTDVGLSDFRVDIVLADPELPDRQLVAVLLDGESWNDRRTVADRDAFPVDVLRTMMRWPAVERVWLPEWLRRRDVVIARLKEAVDEARERVASEAVESPTLKPPASTTSPLSSLRASTLPSRPSPVATAPKTPKPQSHPMIRPYREWSPGRCGDRSVLDSLSNKHHESRVRDTIVNALEAEAPVHQHRLAKIVAAAFDLSRVNDDRRRSIQRLVPADYVRPGTEPFYWPKGFDPTAWRIVRQPAPGASRAIEEVSLIEIGNAMMIIAELAGGIEPESIKREALNLFGSRRVTQAVGVRLEEALDAALSQRTLQRNASGLIVTC